MWGRSDVCCICCRISLVGCRSSSRSTRARSPPPRAPAWDRSSPQGQSNLICLGPQPYLDTLSLVSSASVVFTDSGGLQEESSVLGVPCLTLRENTERPVTLTLGTSRLVGNDPARIKAGFEDVLSGQWPTGQEIPMWDGKAGERVAEELVAWATR